MTLLRYDEADDLQRLNRLPVSLRVLFALLVVLRILPAYRRFHAKTRRGDPVVLEGIVEQLWKDLLGSKLSNEELQSMVAMTTALIPREDDGWDQETQPYAEDAAAALAYAVRARLTGNVQEAGWAARRGYEAIAHLVASTSDTSGDSTMAEMTVLSDARIQVELARQKRDLEELNELATKGADKGCLREMRARSEREAMSVFSIAH